MAHESREDGAPNVVGRSGDLAQLEAALAGLAPRPARLDTARLMYLAGQESAARSRRSRLAWLWPSVAAVATLAASVFGILLARQPEPHVVERIVYVQLPAKNMNENLLAITATTAPRVVTPPEKTTQPSPLQIPTPHYLQARNLAMSQGVESLPTYQASAGSMEIRPATYRELQNRILEGESTGRRKLPQPGFYSWPSIILRGDSR